MVPGIFAKGIISIPDSRYCTISFSGKMDEFYVYRWNGNKAEILFSQNKNGKWTPLQEVSFTDGIKAMEPHITYDGNKIYFYWDKPTPAGEQEIPFKIWYTERTPKSWTEPKYAGPGMFVSSDKEGNIYTTDMTSVMTDGKTYLAKVKSENNKFVSFEKLSVPQYFGSQAHPCIAPDGSFIIFDVESGRHLLVSFKKQDGTWGDAIDLTKNGFDDMAGGASITPDGKYLFFNEHGQLMWVDIRIIKRLKPKK
jgi:Tol biopolymer transport system component